MTNPIIPVAAPAPTMTNPEPTPKAPIIGPTIKLPPEAPISHACCKVPIAEPLSLGLTRSTTKEFIPG